LHPERAPVKTIAIECRCGAVLLEVSGEPIVQYCHVHADVHA
jgi:hypothetical protein